MNNKVIGNLTSDLKCTKNVQRQTDLVNITVIPICPHGFTQIDFVFIPIFNVLKEGEKCNIPRCFTKGNKWEV